MICTDFIHSQQLLFLSAATVGDCKTTSELLIRQTANLNGKLETTKTKNEVRRILLS